MITDDLLSLPARFACLAGALGSGLGNRLGSGALGLLVVGLVHGDILIITEALVVLICIRLCLRDKILCLQPSKHLQEAG